MLLASVQQTHGQGEKQSGCPRVHVQEIECFQSMNYRVCAVETDPDICYHTDCHVNLNEQIILD